MPGLLGKKIGMTSVFSADGKNVPCTVIEAGPCVVTQIKSVEKDGYAAVQVGFQDKKEKHTTKPLMGHFKKAGVTPKRHLAEFKDFETELNLGDTITVELFNDAAYVDVVGTSKGKGFQGVIKRIKMANEKDRFDGDVSCHYHGKCIKCNNVIDIFLKENIDLSIDEHVKNETNINVVSHDIIFNVICPNCDK